MKEFQLFFLKERVILIGINSLPPPEKKKKKRINEAKKKVNIKGKKGKRRKTK